jgi:hypothetical protein
VVRNFPFLQKTLTPTLGSTDPPIGWVMKFHIEGYVTEARNCPHTIHLLSVNKGNLAFLKTGASDLGLEHLHAASEHRNICSKIRNQRTSVALHKLSLFTVLLLLGSFK